MDEENQFKPYKGSFEFFKGKITLQEYLHSWGYNSMDELYAMCEECDNLKWYYWVEKEFNFKK